MSTAAADTTATPFRGRNADRERGRNAGETDMTVKELIDELAKMPPDTRVAFNFDGEWRPASFVEKQEGRWSGTGHDAAFYPHGPHGDEAVVIF